MIRIEVRRAGPFSGGGALSLADGRRALVEREARHSRDDWRAGERERTGGLKAATDYRITRHDSEVTEAVVAVRGLPGVRSSVDEHGLTEGRTLRGRTTYVEGSRHGEPGESYRATEGTHARDRAYDALVSRIRSNRALNAATVLSGARNA